MIAWYLYHNKNNGITKSQIFALAKSELPATDSDVEEITAEKLAAKPAEKLIWHFLVDRQWAAYDGILGYADSKQGVTRVKEERERD